MRTMKKLLALALALALGCSLAGCMADPSVETPSPGSVVVPGDDSPAPSAAFPFAETGMRIALYTSPGTVDDRAQNAACYEGILNFIVSRNIIDSITPLQETTGDPDSALQFLRDTVSGYDVLVCVGSAYSKVADLARENPEKYFFVLDAVPEGESDNLCAVSYAEEQCGFFAGIAAAMETATGYVAVVNSLPDEANTRYYYGFRSGVAYTNGNFGTAAEVVDLPEYAGTSASGIALGGNFTGSATDQSAAYTLTQALIAQNCDVLFVAAGASGIGAYTAAGEHDNVWLIGSETDQFPQGQTGTRNLVLTSVTKSLSLETEARLNSIIKGTFQSGSRRLTAADNALGYVSASDHQQMDQKTLQVLSDAYPMMQNGTIVPGTGPQ